MNVPAIISLYGFRRKEGQSSEDFLDSLSRQAEKLNIIFRSYNPEDSEC